MAEAEDKFAKVQSFEEFISTIKEDLSLTLGKLRSVVHFLGHADDMAMGGEEVKSIQEMLPELDAFDRAEVQIFVQSQLEELQERMDDTGRLASLDLIRNALQDT